MATKNTTEAKASEEKRVIKSPHALKAPGAKSLPEEMLAATREEVWDLYAAVGDESVLEYAAEQGMSPYPVTRSDLIKQYQGDTLKFIFEQLSEILDNL